MSCGTCSGRGVVTGGGARCLVCAGTGERTWLALLDADALPDVRELLGFLGHALAEAETAVNVEQAIAGLAGVQQLVDELSEHATAVARAHRVGARDG
jgi:hypothetical protein